VSLVPITGVRSVKRARRDSVLYELYLGSPVRARARGRRRAGARGRSPGSSRCARNRFEVSVRVMPSWRSRASGQISSAVGPPTLLPNTLRAETAL
jgi:hypothetical protein